MGCEVYANGNTIACKAADGKTVAAMPDVCLSPPSPPAGPVPIPYPNTGMASDATNGSKTVQINGQEVMLKNQSYFKQSSGDEAATKSLGMGVVTHQIQGKVNFINWSMDVKFEGQNVPRHLDMTGHNEASDPPNCPPWPYVDKNAVSDGTCKDEREAEEKACGDLVARTKTGRLVKNRTSAAICDKTNPQAAECRKARQCRLTPQDEGSNENEVGCCDGEQAHHLIEAHGFVKSGTRDNFEGSPLTKFAGPPAYRPGDAPCVCATGDRWTAEHGAFHALVGQKESAAVRKAKGAKKDNAWNYGDAKNAGANAHKRIFPGSGCTKACLEAQLDAYHNKIGANDRTTLQTETADLQPWQKGKTGDVINQMKKDLQGIPSISGSPP
jgi:uncharacterized Zn-binding protein involved in type VI secretion